MEYVCEIWIKSHALQAKLFRYKTDVTNSGEPELTLYSVKEMVGCVTSYMRRITWADIVTCINALE